VKVVLKTLVRILTSSWVKCSANFVNKFLQGGITCKSLLVVAKKVDEKKKKNDDESENNDKNKDLEKEEKGVGGGGQDMDDDDAQQQIEDQLNQLQERLPKILTEDEQVEITRETVVQHLTPLAATNIVLLALVWVPDEIPQHFADS